MNPDSAHFSASAGNLNAGSPRCNGEKTSPSAPPIVTAIKPIDAGGNGSVISARIVATNSARYRQANGARPEGGGRSASVTPTATGTAVRHSRVGRTASVSAWLGTPAIIRVAAGSPASSV